MFDDSTEIRESDNIKTHKNKLKELTDEELGEIFKHFPKIKKNKLQTPAFIQFLKDIVQHVHSILKKEQFDNEYIDKYFAKLSTRNLLTQGKTFYMTACLDFVLITLESLKRSGIEDIHLVINEIQTPENNFKVHF